MLPDILNFFISLYLSRYTIILIRLCKFKRVSFLQALNQSRSLPLTAQNYMVSFELLVSYSFSKLALGTKISFLRPHITPPHSTSIIPKALSCYLHSLYRIQRHHSSEDPFPTSLSKAKYIPLFQMPPKINSYVPVASGLQHINKSKAIAHGAKKSPTERSTSRDSVTLSRITGQTSGSQSFSRRISELQSTSSADLQAQSPTKGLGQPLSRKGCIRSICPAEPPST